MAVVMVSVVGAQLDPTVAAEKTEDIVEAKVHKQKYFIFKVFNLYSLIIIFIRLLQSNHLNSS